MNKKCMFLTVAGLLSFSIVFAMGKVEAEDMGVQEKQTAQEVEKTNSKKRAYYHVLYKARDKAATKEEKNKILLQIVTGPIVESENEDGLLQSKYEAVFELMSGSHTKADAQAVIDQIYKEKTASAKQDMLDALSNSPYKNITVPAYKNIAENDKSLFIRGFATYFYIKKGDEKIGFELVKELFECMDKQNELIEYYNGINAFSNPDMKEKVKKYLVGLKDDGNKGNVIRCYAALICHKKYKTDLEPYYPIFKNTIVNANIKKSAADYILANLKYLSHEKKEIKKIIEEASRTENSIVEK